MGTATESSLFEGKLRPDLHQFTQGVIKASDIDVGNSVLDTLNGEYLWYRQIEKGSDDCPSAVAIDRQWRRIWLDSRSRWGSNTPASVPSYSNFTERVVAVMLVAMLGGNEPSGFLRWSHTHQHPSRGTLAKNSVPAECLFRPRCSGGVLPSPMWLSWRPLKSVVGLTMASINLEEAAGTRET